MWCRSRAGDYDVHSGQVGPRVGSGPTGKVGGLADRTLGHLFMGAQVAAGRLPAVPFIFWQVQLLVAPGDWPEPCEILQIWVFPAR